LLKLAIWIFKLFDKVILVAPIVETNLVRIMANSAKSGP
jgi:hypothetical protein